MIWPGHPGTRGTRRRQCCDGPGLVGARAPLGGIGHSVERLAGAVTSSRTVQSYQTLGRFDCASPPRTRQTPTTTPLLCSLCSLVLVSGLLSRRLSHLLSRLLWWWSPLLSSPLSPPQFSEPRSSTYYGYETHPTLVHICRYTILYCTYCISTSYTSYGCSVLSVCVLSTRDHQTVLPTLRRRNIHPRIRTDEVGKLRQTGNKRLLLGQLIDCCYAICNQPRTRTLCVLQRWLWYRVGSQRAWDKGPFSFTGRSVHAGLCLYIGIDFLLLLYTNIHIRPQKQTSR
jgi:hypothetical protein